MPLTALVPLPDLDQYPQLKRGTLINQLFRLVEKDFPIVPTYVATPELIKALLNNDHQVGQALATAIETTFGEYHVRITNGRTNHANCFGNANIVASLKEIAANGSDQPIAMQINPQPDYSGSLVTNYRHTKLMQLKAVAGAYDHQNTAVTMTIDPRSWHVTDQQNRFSTYYHRGTDQVIAGKKPSHFHNYLNTDFAIAIAQLSWQMKSYFLEHQHISWFSVDKDIFITEVMPLAASQTTQSIQLARGKSLQYQTTNTTGELIRPGSQQLGILLVPELRYEHLRTTPRITGIVTQKAITSTSLITLLTNRKIPTIHQVEPWRSLRVGQKVKLDTATGSIRKPDDHPEMQATKTASTIVTQLGLHQLQANSDQQAQTNIHLDGSQVIADFGFHPNHLVHQYNDRLTDLLSRKLEPLIRDTSQTFFYSLSDIPANQRAQLQYGHSFEDREQNTAFGKRGVQYGIENANLWQAEVTAVTSACHHLKPHIIIPGARSISELLLAFTILERTKQNCQWWIEIRSWHMLHDVQKHLKQIQTKNFVLDMAMLHASYLGYDPASKHITKAYQLWPTHLQKQLAEFTQTIKNQGGNVSWLANQYTAQILDQAATTGLQYILVPQKQVDYFTSKLYQIENHG